MAESRDITAEDARTAAQIEADVGVEHVANVYAKALLPEKAGQTAAVLEEFDAVMAEVVDRFPKLDAILASILVSPEEKSGVIDRVFGGRVSPLLVNFLKVVSRHGRLDCLRAIHRQTRRTVRKLRGRIPRPAHDRHPAVRPEVRQLTESLRAKLGGEPFFSRTSIPSLIGGAVLRIGDMVYDGSIANQLQNLRQK